MRVSYFACLLFTASLMAGPATAESPLGDGALPPSAERLPQTPLVTDLPK